MRNDTPINLPKFEWLIAYFLLALTPFVMSSFTFDSYILPKYVWLVSWASLGSITVVYQPFNGQLIRSPLNKPLLSLVILSCLSILWHYKSPVQMRAWINLGTMVVLFLGFQRFWRREKSPVRVTRTLMVVACLLALYGLLQDYGIDFVLTSGGVRDWRAKVIATLGNPNFLAGYLAILMPVVIGYGLRKETRGGGFLFSCLTVLLITACHSVTFSVGAATGLIGALIATVSGAFFLGASFRFSLLRSLTLLLVAACSIGWYMLDNPYNSHGRSLYRQAWESPQWWSGMGARRFIWQTTRLMIEDQPVSGIGFGNYLAVHEHYQGLNYKRQWHAHDRDYVIPVDQPHFQLLETAAETGPVGVFILCWLVLAWMKLAGRKLRSTHDPWFAWGAYAGVWVAVIHSFSSFPFHLPANALLVVILASYLSVLSTTQPVSYRNTPVWIKITTLTTALTFCLFTWSHFAGNYYLRQGYELSRQGYVLESIDRLDKARWLDPWSHQVHLLLGIQYKSLGWNQSALQSFQSANRLQVDLTCHKELADIYRSLGNRPAAIREMERIIELNPVYPGHYRALMAYLGKEASPQRMEELEALATQLENQLQKHSKDSSRN